MGTSRRFEIRQLLEFAGPEVVIDMVLELDREVSRLTKRVEVLGKIADARLSRIRELRGEGPACTCVVGPTSIVPSQSCPQHGHGPIPGRK